VAASAPIPVAIFGITGRMGQSLLKAMREDSRWRLSGGLASVDHPRLGLEAALEGRPTGVTVTADLNEALRGARVAIDFSIGTAVAAHAAACAKAQVALLVGATSLDAAAHDALQRAASQIAVLVAANTSVGVSVLLELASRATRALGEGFDVEIHEAHHRLKQDAPSGTALALGEAVAQARGASLTDLAAYERLGAQSARRPGSIGFSVVRAGEIVGEHTVVFAGAGETPELTLRATDRQVFARGALQAAAWLAEQAPGRYGMKNLFGL
jgi:4-hydroxy-tetrahydrodipicolinate reductase